MNHLMFMDDIKLFGRNMQDVEALIQTVRIITDDMRMAFGIDKCAVVQVVRGKITHSEGVVLPSGETMGDLEGQGYKYLGILETDQIRHKEMKEKVTKEYFTRVRAVLKSKLNGGNTMKAINTWAVPIIRYNAGVVVWTKEEVEKIDRKTRKMFTVYRALAPRASVARLYLPRSEGGRGLMSVEDTVESECRALGHYLQSTTDTWLLRAWDMKVIKNAMEAKDYKKMVNTRRREEWHSKPLHGQFIRQTQNQSTDESWRWLRKGDLKRETEGMLTAAQDQALQTRKIRADIRHERISPRCRRCGEKDETINHIASECPRLAQGAYKRRHDTVARALHWSLSMKYDLPRADRWYEHQPQTVSENAKAKLLWDMNINTDRVIEARRPDIVVVNKEEGATMLIDVAVPWDSRVEDKEREKIEKYTFLAKELERLWSTRAEVVPVIIGALGTIPRGLKRNLDKIQCRITSGVLQKSVVLATGRILRSVLDSS